MDYMSSNNFRFLSNDTDSSSLLDSTLLNDTLDSSNATVSDIYADYGSGFYGLIMERGKYLYGLAVYTWVFGFVMSVLSCAI